MLLNNILFVRLQSVGWDLNWRDCKLYCLDPLQPWIF